MVLTFVLTNVNGECKISEKFSFKGVFYHVSKYGKATSSHHSSHGEVVFAAVYDPYLDEMFSAVKGHGAFLNGTPIDFSKPSPVFAATEKLYEDAFPVISL